MGEEKKGFWSRLVSGLSKTRDNIVSGIDSIFSGFSSIDDDFYEEIEEIQSFFEDAPHDATSLWFLGESIKLLGQADFVYFCKEWDKYRGCIAENTICNLYEIPHIEDHVKEN